MSRHRVRTRAARGLRRPPRLRHGDALETRLQDAARTPGGHSPVLALPETEAELAWTLAAAPAVLFIGAQSSLTGGATPFGEWLVSSEHFDHLQVAAGGALVGAGVTLATLERALHPLGLCYPPAPTFRGATVGGTLATNAAGAATFKHGSTRAWVEALSVVLASGEVLDLERGQCVAHPAGWVELEALDGRVTRVPLPRYRLPDVPKCSAGYHSAPGLDLIDLFVGSEGTLGFVSAARLRLRPAPETALVWLTLRDVPRALELVSELRARARAAWRGQAGEELDVAAVESLDRRSLQLLHEDGAYGGGAPLDPQAAMALLVQLELPAGGGAQALEGWAGVAAGQPARGALAHLLALVERQAALETVELALPGEVRAAARLGARREAVPEAVNRRVARVQREQDARVHKLGGDMCVPWQRLGPFLARTREAFESRGLDHAVWGHLSDGNLHPNLLPRSAADMEPGAAALLELGEAAIELGGSPMGEHGVGRSRIKQRLLRRLLGEDGLAQMRAVKQALDPEGRLAPGVLLGS